MSSTGTIDAAGSETARTTWTIDPAHSEAGFAVKHLMITTVRGSFGKLSGTVVLDEAHPDRSLVEADIDVATIDTRDAQRDAHLRSADFFDVENHPKMTFRSRAVRRSGDDTYSVVGDLTIRGTTRTVELEVTDEGRARDPWGGERAAFNAKTKIDRRDFGLTWNQALEAGGVLVGNEVKITLEIQGVKAS